MEHTAGAHGTDMNISYPKSQAMQMIEAEHAEIWQQRFKCPRCGGASLTKIKDISNRLSIASRCCNKNLPGLFAINYVGVNKNEK